MSRKFNTREEWLEAAVLALRARVFEGCGQPDQVPEKLQVLCSFPVGSRKAIGMAWNCVAARDKETYNIAVSPVLDAAYQVLDTLVHEMCHAALYKNHPDHKHGAEFRRMARAVGLVKPWTATSIDPASATQTIVLELEKELGPYPHSALMPAAKKKPAASGWVRLVSVNDDKYKVVISPKVLEASGAPQDPWGDEMVLAE